MTRVCCPICPGRLQGKGIDDRGKHTHVIARHAVHTLRGESDAAKDVSPPTTTATSTPCWAIAAISPRDPSRGPDRSRMTPARHGLPLS